MADRKYWLSTKAMTVQVDVNEVGYIIAAAPIVRKFVGQPIANLRKWLMRQGGFRWTLLETCEKGS